MRVRVLRVFRGYRGVSFAGKVAFPKRKLHARPRRLHGYFAKLTVPISVGGIVSQLIVGRGIIDRSFHALRQVIVVQADFPAGLLREVIHRFLTRKANVALAVQRRSLRKRIQFPPRLRVEKRLRFHAPGIHWIHGDLRIRHGARNGGHFAAVIAHSAESRDHREVCVRRNGQRKRGRQPDQVFSPGVSADVSGNHPQRVQCHLHADVHGIGVLFPFKSLKVQRLHRQQRVGVPACRTALAAARLRRPSRRVALALGARHLLQ